MRSIANLQYEQECLASKYLKYKEVPVQICELVYFLSDLPDIVYSKEQDKIDSVKRTIVDSEGYLRDSTLNKIYRGNIDKLIKDMVEISESLVLAIPALNKANEIITLNHMHQVSSSINNLQDFGNMGIFLATTPQNPKEVTDINNAVADYTKYIQYTRSIKELYGSGDGVRNYKDTYDVSTSSDILSMCMEIESKIKFLDFLPPKVIYIVGSICDYLYSTLQQNKLDPRQLDVAKDAYSIFTDLDKYSYDCKEGEVLDVAIGNLMGSLFSEHYKKVSEQFFNKNEESMPNEDRVNYIYGLGMKQDNSSLVQLTSQYVTRKFQPT